MKRIPLTQGKFALVDDEDFAELSKVKWCFSKGYAVRSVRLEKRGTILMHREILSAKKGQECDHINMNGLDNRRANLRVCTRAENARNRPKDRDNTTGFKGVALEKRTGKYVAQIHILGKHYHFGTFKSAKEAALAYNEAAPKYFGEFAQLNPV